MSFGHGRKLYELLQESWPLQLRHPWEEKPVEEMQLYTTVAHKFVTYLKQTEWDRIGQTEHALKNKAYLKEVEGEDWGTLTEYSVGKEVYQLLNYPESPESAWIVWPHIGKELQLRFIAIGKGILTYLEEQHPLLVVREKEKGPKKLANVLTSLEVRAQKVELGQDINQDRLTRMEAYLTKDREKLMQIIGDYQILLGRTP